MLWQAHDSFDTEYRKIAKKIRTLDLGLNAARLLLSQQFDPNSPCSAISPGKLHRVYANSTWAIWKLEMAVPKSGLRPNQWPRIWFAVAGDAITLLAIGSHVQNYDNNTMDRLAVDRYSEIA